MDDEEMAVLIEQHIFDEGYEQGWRAGYYEALRQIRDKLTECEQRAEQRA